MSYILDALKKAEQKRRQGAVPDLLTFHDPGQMKAGTRANWPYVLIVILIMGVGVVPWLYEKYSVTKKTPSPPTSSIIRNKLTENSSHDAIQKERPPVRHDRQTAPQKSPDAVRKTARRADAAFVDAPVSPANASLPEERSHSKQVTLKEHELPAAIQQEIPKLEISAHMYNVAPSSRVIIIHGNVVHEGESVASGLRLESITPDGVILSYKGYSFYRTLFQ